MISNISSNYRTICGLFDFSKKNVENQNQIIENFFSSSKFSNNTRRSFNRVLRVFFNWIKDKEISEVIQKDIVDFIDHIRFVKKSSISTSNLHLACLKSFFRWMLSQKSIEYDPCEKIKGLKMIRKINKLEVEQICKIFQDVELKKDFRANSLLHLLFFTNLRSNDLLGLKLKDISNFTNNLVKKSLEDYVKTRAEKISKTHRKTDFLFIGERGPIKEKGLRLICSKYNFSPRTLKSTIKNWTGDDFAAFLESKSKFNKTKSSKRKVVANLRDDNPTKQCVSITEMSKTLSISRQRFNQLVKLNIFPKPDYHPTTKRPFYDATKQKMCVLVRSTNTGINGEPILFYKNRSDVVNKKNKKQVVNKKNKKQVVNDESWIDWV